MLFNSLAFLVFLPTIFILYWFILKNNKGRNVLLLLASYLFYGWWDWRFLSLIIFSSLVDYLVGKRMENEENQQRRKHLLFISIFVNLGLLGFFKYFNFFIDSFINSFDFLGINLNVSTLHIILPVGISFYTFQTMSYTIDLYKRKIKPCNDPLAFFTFVAFFPQLVAGPIERASHLLPQFYKKRNFDYTQAVSGLRLILWGMFKKVVIADRLAEYVNIIYNDPSAYTGVPVILGTIFFAFQIYCDFSGYSDIAIGTARLFGFDLMTNFRTPYFSKTIKEFWSRWHISLSTWFRDYVYIPLGGNRASTSRWITNLMITFIVSGFWHGANWTFVIWGAIHGVVNGIEALNSKFQLIKFRLPTILQVMLTFSIVCFAWIFFRANSFGDAIVIIQNSFDFSNGLSNVKIISAFDLAILLLLVGFLVSIELILQSDNTVNKLLKNQTVRYISYVTLILLIVFFGVFQNKQDFIYFQF